MRKGVKRSKINNLKKFLKIHLKYLNNKTTIKEYKFNNRSNINYLKNYIIKRNTNLEKNKNTISLFKQ